MGFTSSKSKYKIKCIMGLTKIHKKSEQQATEDKEKSENNDSASGDFIEPPEAPQANPFPEFIGYAAQYKPP